MTFCVTSRFNEMRPSFLSENPLPSLRESAIGRILCGNRSIVPAGEGHAAVSSIDAHAWAASTYMTSAQNTQPGGGGGYQGEIRSLQICRTSFLHRSVEDAAALRIRPPDGSTTARLLSGCSSCSRQHSRRSLRRRLPGELRCRGDNRKL